MAFRFYCVSSGLVGYIMDIVHEAQSLVDPDKLKLALKVVDNTKATKRKDKRKQSLKKYMRYR